MNISIVLVSIKILECCFTKNAIISSFLSESVAFFAKALTYLTVI
jgi:hypothetical protein